MALPNLKRKRTALRNVVEKNLLPKCDELIQKLKEDTSDDVKFNLAAAMETLEMKFKTIQELDSEILDLLDADSIEQDVVESTEFELKITYFLSNVKKHSEESRVDNVNKNELVKSSVKVKLPTLSIDKFDGNPLKWQTFIDSFESSVDKRTDLTPIQKFQYLSSFLEKAAKKCIEGFPLTNDNYAQALDMLKNNYGNPQLVISAHMSKIIKLDAVHKGTSPQLRELLHNIESHVRSLESQGVNKEHFGSLLIPIIKEKLPQEIRLEVSRKLGKESWKIDDFLKCIKDEIDARDNCSVDTKGGESVRKKDESNQPCTIQTLMNSIDEIKKEMRKKPKPRVPTPNRKKFCVYCKIEDDHYSDQCGVVSDNAQRMELLKNENRCFLCLQVGHSRRKCRSNKICYTCKSSEHHTSLCRNKGTHTMLIKQTTSTLLQTAYSKVCNPVKSKFMSVRILFDSCSQRTYVSERVVKNLGLRPITSKTVTVKTFGNEKGQQMDVNEYEICLNTRDNMCVYVKALSVPDICGSICGQYVDLAIKQHPFLETLTLADTCGRGNIDLLIGADFYWSLVSGEVKKDDNSGLVAVKSKLGWLISGPVRVEGREGDIMTNCTYVMKIACDDVDEVNLKNDLKCFWDLDTLGIREDELTVCTRKSVRRCGF